MRLGLSFFYRFFIIAFWSVVFSAFLMLPKVYWMLRQEKSLTIFTWPLMLDPIYLKNFEKETGIKLYIVYYDSSAALLNKLEASNGHGYDLIIADDRTTELIIKKKLVQPFEYNKLSFVNDFNPILRSQYFDPGNAYTIPHYWGLYGLGYDSQFFKDTFDPTWAVLFKPDVSYRICMTDDPREALSVAAQYLFGSIDALKNPEKIEQIKKLLIAQKKNVEVYSIARADNLLQSKSCAVATIMNPEIQRLQREHPHIKFVSPKEGGFMIIDLFLMSKASHKQDLIYQFLNYLYKPEVVAHHMNMFGYCSPFKNVENSPCNDIKNHEFFKNIIPDRDINNIWIEILGS
jgi:spermidine/putrescine transport system substrate-binding protein